VAFSSLEATSLFLIDTKGVRHRLSRSKEESVKFLKKKKEQWLSGQRKVFLLPAACETSPFNGCMGH
jgi:hypothetical protein